MRDSVWKIGAATSLNGQCRRQAWIWQGWSSGLGQKSHCPLSQACQNCKIVAGANHSFTKFTVPLRVPTSQPGWVSQTPRCDCVWKNIEVHNFSRFSTKTGTHSTNVWGLSGWKVGCNRNPGQKDVFFFLFFWVRGRWWQTYWWKYS